MKYSRLRSLMRFSLRDLFWLTVVVAMAAGWWADRREQARRYENLKQGMQLLSQRMFQDGYRIGWNGQENTPVITSPSEQPTPTAPQPSALPASSAPALDPPKP